jgi:(R,R)-butanediol dehydrogenase/meso-butanediol dehydrogenase/diacetyl reductase
MEALIYRGGRGVVVEEAPEPSCSEGCALIRVTNAGICGSDIFASSGHHPRIRPPVILGHEFSGVVEKVCADASNLAPGDRVTVEPVYGCGTCRYCRSGRYNLCPKFGIFGIDTDGAFTSYISVPVHQIFKLPEGLSLEEGALIEPLAVVVHSVRISRMEVGHSVAVLGAGPIGLLTAQVVHAIGAKDVVVIEPSKFRREKAAQMGFGGLPPEEATADAFSAAGGRPFDIIYDTTGAAPAVQSALELVKRGGQVVLTGIHKQATPLDLMGITYNQLDLLGSFCYTFQDVEAGLALAGQEKVALRPLITDSIQLRDGPAAIEELRSGKTTALKTLFAIT